MISLAYFNAFKTTANLPSALLLYHHSCNLFSSSFAEYENIFKKNIGLKRSDNL